MRLPLRLRPPLGPCPVRLRRVIAAVALVVGWALWDGDGLARAAWRPPVPGPVVAAFRFDRAAPYARGQRRGIDLAASPGATVSSACGGVVAYAGRVAGQGAGVTVRCGALVATHLGLARVTVRRGERVGAGTSLGLAASTTVRLGARRSGERHGYVDAAALLRRPHPARPAPPPLAPPHREAHPPAPHIARRRADPFAAHAAGRRAAPLAGRSAPLARGSAVPGRGGVSPLAWIGLGLLALAVPGGGVARRRRRRATVGVRVLRPRA